MNNDGLVWFYCENCFNAATANLAPLLELFKSLADKFKWAENGMFSYINGFICPYCGSYHDTFKVDFEMIPIIKKLNEKGYITKAHCSGHDHSNCFYSEDLNEAYVFMYHSDNLREYLSSITTDQLIYDDCKDIVDIIVEISDGDGIEEPNGICIRSRFKDHITEDQRRSKYGIGILSYTLALAITKFPENTDEIRITKYNCCDENGKENKENE